jgi:hypothetical protein
MGGRLLHFSDRALGLTGMCYRSGRGDAAPNPSAQIRDASSPLETLGEMWHPVPYEP